MSSRIFTLLLLATLVAARAWQSVSTAWPNGCSEKSLPRNGNSIGLTLNRSTSRRNHRRSDFANSALR